MVVRNADFIQYINEKGSVTAEELQDKFHVKMSTVRSWLSRNKTNGTLIYIKIKSDKVRDRPRHRTPGRYALSDRNIDRLAYWLM